jgi:hypothetical protein
VNHSVLDPETPKQDVKPIDSRVRWSWSDSPLVRQDGVRPTGTRCTGLGLLQALTEANVAIIEILNLIEPSVSEMVKYDMVDEFISHL